MSRFEEDISKLCSLSNNLEEFLQAWANFKTQTHGKPSVELLCDACIDILDKNQNVPRRLLLASTLNAFVESAKTCFLCYYLVSSVEVNAKSYREGIEQKLHTLVRNSLSSCDFETVIVIYPRSELGKGGRTIYVCMEHKNKPPAMKLECRGLKIDISLEQLDERPIWWMNNPSDSARRVDVIKYWLRNCKDNHASCIYQPTLLPTRVLDIGSVKSPPTVRLWNTNGQSGYYAALSHCWGDIAPLQTLSTTFASHVEGIDMSKLPKTFLDTVMVLRELEVRYLWIDTLCIIQDDEMDWAKEGASMKNVYSNAILTIAASAAKNCTEGLWRPFKPSTIHPYFVLRVKEASRSERESLATRAWSLQEQLLSRRIVHFGRRPLHWTCSQHVDWEDAIQPDGYNELGLYGIEDLIWASDCQKYFNLDQALMERKGVSRSRAKQALYRCWEQIAMQYSARSITFVADRLPALAGLTEHFQELLVDEALIGLWRDDVAICLCWQVRETGQRGNIIPELPSWSWTCVLGEVSYFEDSFTRLYDRVPRIRFDSADIKWASIPMTSRLQKAQLSVTGKMSRISLRESKSFRFDLGNGDQGGVAVLDLPLAQSEVGEALYFLLCVITRDKDMTVWRWYGLILVASELGPNSYHRRGLGIRYHQSPGDLEEQKWEGVVEQTISLV
jgi:hypothetical protein